MEIKGVSQPSPKSHVTMQSKDISAAILPNPGSELGLDQVSLSRNFVTASSTASSIAASASKNSLQDQDAVNTEMAKEVSTEKVVAASQADTGINEKNKKENCKLDQVQAQSQTQAPQDCPQVFNLCGVCNGAGCYSCRPDIIAIFTQEERSRRQQLEEIRHLRAKEGPSKSKKIDRIMPVEGVATDNTNDKLLSPTRHTPKAKLKSPKSDEEFTLFDFDED